MIAEVHAGDWNRRYPRPENITPVSRHARLDGEDAPDEDGQARVGDCLLQQLNRCRGMMLSSESWPAVIRDFAARWTEYKSANRVLDFCDLIEVSLRDVPAAPDRPSVLVVDEAQDLNRMQLTLIRSWSECARYLVLAGDDDQTIYAWAGASPEAILEPEIPEVHKVFLKESVRVPRAVHPVAERLIRQLSRRQEKVYRARPADGEVVRLSRAGYRSPEYWILKTAERHLAQGKNDHVPGVVLVYGAPDRRGAEEVRHPFSPIRTARATGSGIPCGPRSRESAANRLLALLAGHHGFGDGNRRWRFGDLALLDGVVS